MKPIVLHVYEDPGHAWVKVKRSLLHEIHISKRITEYSYQRGEWVYLEEDEDAGTLTRSLDANGIRYSLRFHSSNRRSRIRNYEHYQWS